MPRSRRVRALVAAVAIAGLAVAACSDGGADGSVSTTATTLQTTPEPSTTAVPSTDAAAPETTTAPPPAPVPVEPPRSSVWVHLFDDTLKSQTGVDELLDEVAAAGIEAVIAQVARRHDAYYRSGYLPPTPDPALTPGFDVLEALVEGGHERDLQVHAWFVVAPAIHHQYDGLVLPPGMAWAAHGPDSADSWMTVASDGTVSRDYFDVGIDAVHDHAVAIIDDIAGRYEIDGVHLDYVRYDGSRWGYHPDALAQFSRDTGRSDRPAPGDRQWIEWRQGRTAALMERAHEALSASRPGALLSAAVIAGGPGPSASPGGFAGTRASELMFQDWPTWLDAGHVDFLLTMAYTREANAEHAGWFRQWVDFAGDLADRHPGRVGVGVGAYLNSVDEALVQVRLVQERVGAVGIYSYQQDSAGSVRGAVLARCCGG
jgi:uncharacterized lipoprotein YddW (UPF0748 family)